MNSRNFMKKLFIIINYSKCLPIVSLSEDIQKRKFFLELDDGSKFKICIRPYRKAI